MAANAWNEEADSLRKFASKNKLRHQILLDAATLHGKYGIASVPVSVWIDREGKVADVAIGFDSPKTLESKTKAVLARR